MLCLYRLNEMFYGYVDKTNSSTNICFSKALHTSIKYATLWRVIFIHFLFLFTRSIGKAIRRFSSHQSNIVIGYSAKEWVVHTHTKQTNCNDFFVNSLRQSNLVFTFVSVQYTLAIYKRPIWPWQQQMLSASYPLFQCNGLFSNDLCNDQSNCNQFAPKIHNFSKFHVYMPLL